MTMVCTNEEALRALGVTDSPSWARYNRACHQAMTLEWLTQMMTLFVNSHGLGKTIRVLFYVGTDLGNFGKIIDVLYRFVIKGIDVIKTILVLVH